MLKPAESLDLTRNKVLMFIAGMNSPLRECCTTLSILKVFLLDEEITNPQVNAKIMPCLFENSFAVP